MKIKVCGITSVEQLQQLTAMQIEFAGLIFTESSPRYAYTKLEAEKEAVRNVRIKKIGVFVNAEIDTILQMIDDFGLWAVQLHGDEDPAYARELNRHIPVIKAFRVTGEENINETTKPFNNACTYFLFDTYTGDGTYGGSGRSFSWDNLLVANVHKPFFLSGGISPTNAGKVKAFSHPSLYAVDINSQFETAPGIKNLDLVQDFKKNLDQKETPIL